MNDSIPIDTKDSLSRIYLVGMMGVGKTTLGRQLANHLNYAFVDLDKQIEQQEGRSIQEIFEKEGEDYFRIAEQKALHQTIHLPHTVIATGGGTPCFFDNMYWIQHHGKSIYLKASQAFIISRVEQNIDKRPLLKGKTSAEIGAFIKTLLAAREAYYEQASFTVTLPVKSFVLSVKSML